jgi:hypothetical protein
MTERTRVHFTAKRAADGRPWIMLEAVVENLSVLDEGILGFDLPEGTSDDRAREIETFLNENITNAHFTYFPPQKKA